MVDIFVYYTGEMFMGDRLYFHCFYDGYTIKFPVLVAKKFPVLTIIITVSSPEYTEYVWVPDAELIRLTQLLALSMFRPVDTLK